MCFVQKVAESLDSIFRSESRVLDTTATIDITTQQLFPYDLLFNWVKDTVNFQYVTGSVML